MLSVAVGCIFDGNNRWPPINALFWKVTEHDGHCETALMKVLYWTGRKERRICHRTCPVEDAMDIDLFYSNFKECMPFCSTFLLPLE